MERAGAEEWAKRVERWKRSGLTAKEFATRDPGRAQRAFAAGVERAARQVE